MFVLKVVALLAGGAVAAAATQIALLARKCRNEVCPNIQEALHEVQGLAEDLRATQIAMLATQCRVEVCPSIQGALQDVQGLAQDLRSRGASADAAIEDARKLFQRMTSLCETMQLKPIKSSLSSTKKLIKRACFVRQS